MATLHVDRYYLIVVADVPRVCKLLSFTERTIKVSCGRDEFIVIPYHIDFILPLSGEGH